MGGDDKSINLVRLTPEEHYIAHQLLVKMYPGNLKLIFAAHRMTSGPNEKRNNNKLYGWLRRKHSKAVSETLTGRKRKPHTKETKLKISKAKIQFYKDNPGKTSKGCKLLPLTAEHKKKISLIHKGRKHSAEHIRNNSEAHKGQIPWSKGKKLPPLSDKTKNKISKSLLGGKASAETKLKMSKIRKGVPWSKARRDAFNQGKTET